MGRLSAVSRIAIPLAGVLVLSSCSTDDTPNDTLQIVQNPVAATAAVSPVVTVKPAGSVFAAPGVKALVTDEASKTLVVAVSEPPSLRIYDLAALDAPKATVALPGPAERLTVSGSQVLASVPGKSLLAKISLPGGALETVPVAGQPSAGLAAGDATLVSVRDRKAVEVLSKNAGPKTITGQIYSADDVLNTGDGVVVLDKLRTALFAVDLDEGKIGEGLRAGDGAANAVTDDLGRVFVTDARAGALLAFSTTPLLLRQRYPFPAARTASPTTDLVASSGSRSPDATRSSVSTSAVGNRSRSTGSPPCGSQIRSPSTSRAAVWSSARPSEKGSR